MIMMLLAFGLIMVFSASSPMAHYKDQGAAYYFKRQLMFAVVGVAVMMMTSSFNYKMWYKLYIVFGVVTLGLLFAVPLVGTVAGGAAVVSGAAALLSPGLFDGVLKSITASTAIAARQSPIRINLTA